MNNDKKCRTALANWVAKYEWDVVGTLKIRDSFSENDALKEVRRYFNKVDRVFYGNKAYRKNVRVQRFVFLQRGAYGDNAHFHFVAKTPTNTNSAKEFCRLLKNIWERKIYISSSKGRFVVAQNKAAISNYLTHEYELMGNDTIEVFTTHTNNKHYIGTQNGKKEQQALVRRAFKATTTKQQRT